MRWWWLLAAVPLVLLVVPKEQLLPLKMRIAVSLLGWQGFLNVVKENIATRTLGLKTTQSREAWHSLADTVSAFDTRYLSPERGVVTDDDIAEGHLYGLHLLTTAVELFAHSDHIHPEFKFALSPWRKWWGDNPDVVYLHCLVHSDLAYIVRGKLSNETYYSLSVYATEKPGQFASRSVSSLNNKELEFNRDGSFEVVVSLTRPERCKNWLQMDPGFMTVISRHYFEEPTPAALNPARASISITPLPAKTLAPPPTDSSMAQRLTWIETFVRDHSFDRPPFDPATSPPWFSFTPNVIGTPSMHQQQHGSKTGGLGALDIAYAAGPWKLAPGEALVIDGRLPPCSFANVVLWNRYLQTLDYAHRPVSLNRRQLKNVTAEGDYRIIVSAEAQNPGRQFNWLDTEGRAGGTVFYRFVLPEGDLAAPRTKVVAMADVVKEGPSPGH